MLDRLEELLDTNPTTEEVSQAFWHACAGGQRRAAERLLAAEADLNWEPDYAHGTHSTQPAASAPAKRTSSDGSKRKEPTPPTPVDMPPAAAAAANDRRGTVQTPSFNAPGQA
jgi:hypothetical protein